MQRIKQFFRSAFFSRMLAAFFATFAHAILIYVAVVLWPMAIAPWTGIAAPSFVQAYMSAMIMSAVFFKLTPDTVVNTVMSQDDIDSPEFAEALAGPCPQSNHQRAAEFLREMHDERVKFLQKHAKTIVDALRGTTYLIIAGIVYLFGIVLL